MWGPLAGPPLGCLPLLDVEQDRRSSLVVVFQDTSVPLGVLREGGHRGVEVIEPHFRLAFVRHHPPHVFVDAFHFSFPFVFVFRFILATCVILAEVGFSAIGKVVMFALFSKIGFEVDWKRLPT